MSHSRPQAGGFGPDIYQSWRDSSLGEITETLEFRLLFQLVGSLQGQSVLDVGCGDGSFALACAQHGAAHIDGCDPDPRMIARAQAKIARGQSSVRFVVARSQALPYPDRSFDVVTCITVLTFIPDIDAALREMARVLRPGGRLVIGDLGRWSVWAARRRIRGWLGAKLWRDARFRTAGQLMTAIRDAGFTIDGVRGAIFFPPNTTAAHLMASFDHSIGRITTLGAAFIAVQATRA